MTTIYIIYWLWSGDPGGGVCSMGFEHKEIAERVCAELNNGSGKTYFVAPVEVPI